MTALVMKIAKICIQESKNAGDQGWANSALREICGSKTVSRAHVVDSFLSLLLG